MLATWLSILLYLGCSNISFSRIYLRCFQDDDKDKVQSFKSINEPFARIIFKDNQHDDSGQDTDWKNLKL